MGFKEGAHFDWTVVLHSLWWVAEAFIISFRAVILLSLFGAISSGSLTYALVDVGVVKKWSEIFFSTLPFVRREGFCGKLRCTISWGFWGEKNNKIFREFERSLSDIWAFSRFNISPWTSVVKPFLITPLGLVSLDWSPFFTLPPFVIYYFFFIFYMSLDSFILHHAILDVLIMDLQVMLCFKIMDLSAILNP